MTAETVLPGITVLLNTLPSRYKFGTEVRLQKLNVDTGIEENGLTIQCVILQLVRRLYGTSSLIIADGGDNFTYQHVHNKQGAEKLFATTFNLSYMSHGGFVVIQWGNTPGADQLHRDFDFKAALVQAENVSNLYFYTVRNRSTIMGYSYI